MDITSILQMHQELSLTAVFLLMFVLDLFLPVRLRHWLRPLACALLGIELLANIWPDEVILFGGMYHSTPMASIMKSVLTLGTILVFLQSTHWLRRSDTCHKMGEFYTLTLSTLLGMYFMVSAGHFLLFFLGLELATVPMACLVAFDKYKGHSAEAGAKFILSALFSSGIFLYGISMIYGRTHTRDVRLMGGLMKIMPFLAVGYVIAGLANLGLPGLSGFVAEMTVFVGSFQNNDTFHRVCTLIATTSIVITAVYILRVVGKILYGKVLNPDHLKLTDATWDERVAVIFLIACVAGLGLAPFWISNLISNSVEPIITQLIQ